METLIGKTQEEKIESMSWTDKERAHDTLSEIAMHLSILTRPVHNPPSVFDDIPGVKLMRERMMRKKNSLIAVKKLRYQHLLNGLR